MSASVMKSRRKVLILTRNFPPLLGGMERLNWHLSKQLCAEGDVRVVGPKGAQARAPEGVRVHEIVATPLLIFLTMCTVSACWIAARWRPAVIVAGSGLTALPAWLAGRLFGIRTVVYVHGLDVEVNHAVYRAFWWPALRQMNRVVANSHSTAASAIKVGVLPQRIGIVNPGVQLPRHPLRPDEMARKKSSLGMTDQPIMISVGRLTERKGLREFVVQALPQIVQAHPGAVLMVVGDEPTDALKARAQTKQSILQAATRAGVDQHLKFLGALTDYEALGAIYEIADVHIFPVREIPDDPEGFGMVAVEAAAHGTPTVAFATGGIVDAVENDQSGCLVPSGDYGAFASAVIGLLPKQQSTSTSCRQFARRFDWARFGDEINQELNMTGPRNGASQQGTR